MTSDKINIKTPWQELTEGGNIYTSRKCKRI